jgi:hypothetical protein
MVLDTSGILPSKLQNSLIWQDHFSKIILQVLKKLDFVGVPCHSHQFFVPNSQCHKITVLPDNSKILMTM